MQWNTDSSWISFPRGPEDDLIKVETCRPHNILFLLYRMKCCVIDWHVVFICYNTSGGETLNKNMGQGTKYPHWGFSVVSLTPFRQIFGYYLSFELGRECVHRRAFQSIIHRTTSTLHILSCWQTNNKNNTNNTKRCKCEILRQTQN